MRKHPTAGVGIEKKCIGCAKAFLVFPYLKDSQRWCSRICRYDPKRRVPMACAQCGKSLRKGKFCSRSCRSGFTKRNDLISERFWPKVKKSTSGCWLWGAGVNEKGYGIFWMNGRNERASRVAWLLTNGGIPDGLYACHFCDNPICVRPSHIFLGSNRENQLDYQKKRRQK